MLNIVKVGITDPNPIVRNAAFFALGQFSEHLQPEVTKFAPQILPILFQFLQQLCVELKSGSTEPKHIDRMFYALETFCENLEEALVPHLPLLMERLFQALDPSSSVRLRELTLSAISAACSAAKEHMLPYFPQLIRMLQSFLAKTDNEDILALRPQAIDTLAALARSIGKANFMPLATDTMKFALELMFDNDYDPDVRRALYNLIASLAEVVNEEMGAVFPKIMDTLFESILSTDEVIPQYKDDAIPVPRKYLLSFFYVSNSIKFSSPQQHKRMKTTLTSNILMEKRRTTLLDTVLKTHTWTKRRKLSLLSRNSQPTLA